MLMRPVRTWFAVLLLAGCGDGAGLPDAAVTPPAATIAFEVLYQAAGLPPGAIAPGRFLTVRALAGSRSLGTRPVATVELVLDREGPRSLAAPTFVDAQGRDNYLFPVSAGYPSTFFARSCTSWLPFTVQVTDTAGLSFTKFGEICPGQDQSLGGFSDYGERIVEYRLEAAAPARLRLMRSARDPAFAGYVDRWHTPVPVASSRTELRAREGDWLWVEGSFEPEAADGSTLTAAVRAEEGGWFAISALAKDAALGLVWADAALECCRGALPPGADTRTVSFVVSPAQLGSIPGGIVPVAPFEAHYRVFDPATATVEAEFRGAGAGYTTWSFPVKSGRQLTLEASPTAPNTLVEVFVTSGSGGDAESPQAGNSLARARSNRPAQPAQLNVLCCSR